MHAERRKGSQGNLLGNPQLCGMAHIDAGEQKVLRLGAKEMF